ncbi:hypothetical protein Sango_2214500 [Sesamum angolense]|uniref:Uncharacterized protein n=1 Tax=Sesamum angolense TaxID=2727404 RepID=A0AAE2BKI2_9LAMI|nr:hypothetical protein Sango_2214500 [Sesamum angolense]
MEYQNSGMLSKDQLLYLFDRFAFLTSHPEVKKRIADAVNDKQEAVAVTTAIQGEIFSEMGVGEWFKLKQCVAGQFFFHVLQLLFVNWQIISTVWSGLLGKVNMTYENDQELMAQFYGFLAKNEIEPV